MQSNQTNHINQNTVEIFSLNTREDEALRYKLAKHLKLLERQGIIKAWHDRNITASEEWKNKSGSHLESANIILLLISSDFLASDYCYDIEMKRSLERHESREARVIPIILRPIDWHLDEAFANVADGLNKIITKSHVDILPAVKRTGIP